MITLYHAQECPFCARVRIVLQEKGLDYTSVEIDLSAPPPFLFDKNPKGTVPVLEEGKVVIGESSDINEYLDQRYPTPPLMPEAGEERRRARDLQGELESALLPKFYALRMQLQQGKRPGEPGAEEATAARDELLKALGTIQFHLDGREYLSGALGLADVAFAPWMAKLELFGVDPDRLPKAVGDWVGRLASRPSVVAQVA